MSIFSNKTEKRGLSSTYLEKYSRRRLRRLPPGAAVVFFKYVENTPLFQNIWKKCPSKGRKLPTLACTLLSFHYLCSKVVQELISSQLGPFVVPSEVHLEPEDFDFEQEEYLGGAPKDFKPHYLDNWIS